MQNLGPGSYDQLNRQINVATQKVDPNIAPAVVFKEVRKELLLRPSEPNIVQTDLASSTITNLNV